MLFNFLNFFKFKSLLSVSSDTMPPPTNSLPEIMSLFLNRIPLKVEITLSTLSSIFLLVVFNWVFDLLNDFCRVHFGITAILAYF